MIPLGHRSYATTGKLLLHFVIFGKDILLYLSLLGCRASRDGPGPGLVNLCHQARQLRRAPEDDHQLLTIVSKSRDDKSDKLQIAVAFKDWEKITFTMGRPI